MCADFVFAEEHAETGGVDEFGLDGEDVGEGEHGGYGDWGRKGGEVVGVGGGDAAGDGEDEVAEGVGGGCSFEGGEREGHCGCGGGEHGGELSLGFAEDGEGFERGRIVVRYAEVEGGGAAAGVLLDGGLELLFVVFCLSL